jgi:glycosyltransferase involved in cell wall biosynthesis
MMTFSIVTPSLNQGRFLGDCLRSVLSQRGDEIQVEHIVRDACSRDGTVEVLKQTDGVVWTSEPDAGQTDAINKGFRKATGDWLMWLNADDYLLPGALEKVRDYALEHPAADVIYGDCLFVDEVGRTLRERREGAFDFWMLLLYGCYIPSTATFFRRDLIDRGLLLDPQFRNCMDTDYFLRLALAGMRFEHIPELLAAFRWHETNASTQFVERRKSERLQIQRQTLQAKGLGWLRHPVFLEPLFRLYQAKRSLRRALGLTP